MASPERQPLSVRVTRPNSPDLDHVKSTILCETSKMRKEVSETVPKSRHTGELHEGNLTIKTIRKRVAGETEDEKHTVTLDGVDQIGRLRDFIDMSLNGDVPNTSGNYTYIPIPLATAHNIKEVLRNMPEPDVINILSDFLARANQSPQVVDALIKRAKSHPEIFSEAVAALNLATYTRAVDELRELIDRSGKEAQFQNILEENPWMFGSEYSKKLTRRNWVRDQQYDFVHRRTTDGYLEIIEIKTPLEGKDLFLYDHSHDSYYPSSKLSAVLGQVIKYVDDFEAARLAVKHKDQEDPYKVRAKIIIGRDGSNAQREALRQLNGHLNRIEVMTFDHLLRVAQRVLSYLSQALHPNLPS